MTMKIDITITDDQYVADFSGDCAGIWGRYVGRRQFVNEWLTNGRSAMERRWAEVHGCDLAFAGKVDWQHDDERVTAAWIVEECPLIALAVMCAEWDGAE